MPPSSGSAPELPVSIPVADTAAPLFGIVLGMVVMIVLALNALAY